LEGAVTKGPAINDLLPLDFTLKQGPSPTTGTVIVRLASAC
jgi:hypothetical protein